MPLTAVSTMALPAVQTMAKEDEAVMKDWIENSRPVFLNVLCEAKQLKIQLGLYHQLSAFSPSKQSIPMWSLIGRKQLLATHWRLLLSLKPLSSQRIHRKEKDGDWYIYL